MIKVTAWFKDKKTVGMFHCLFDAIDFRDIMDANYPKKVEFKNGVFSMSEWIVNTWNSVMDDKRNPLSNIPDTNVRHMVLQVLAWMWCIAFSSYFTSMWMFGITAVAHIFLLAAIAVTVATFETAKRKPKILDFKFHSPSRARYMWFDGKRYPLPKGDPGGEHE